MKTRENKEGEEGKWKVDISDDDYIEQGLSTWGTLTPWGTRKDFLEYVKFNTKSRSDINIRTFLWKSIYTSRGSAWCKEILSISTKHYVS